MSYKRVRCSTRAEYYRLKEAMEVFGMCQDKITALAIECGAFYKIDKVVLTKKKVLSDYIETFKVEGPLM